MGEMLLNSHGQLSYPPPTHHHFLPNRVNEKPEDYRPHSQDPHASSQNLRSLISWTAPGVGAAWS